MAGKKKPAATKQIATLVHDGASRKNIPTAEFQSVMEKTQQEVQTVRYPRNTDLDPQLVWRGKDEQDWSDLVTPAPPLYIQEKVHPKVLIDDLKRVASEKGQVASASEQLDMFSDFNGIPEGADKTEFYQHDQNWSNRMILGDSLQVMASQAEREGLRNKVQCIFFDPPYGIKFNSNFQWSTTSRDVKDGKADHITREPEQVKAFRDTWRDGIHSYLTYLRDRLTVARDLLTDSGSIFVQIGDENVHRVRALMDEVFGDENCVSLIHFQTTTGQAADILPRSGDYVLWYAKQRSLVKYRQLFREKQLGELASYSSAMSVVDGSVRKLSTDENSGLVPVEAGWKVYSAQNLRSQDSGSIESRKFVYHNQEFDCGPSHHWKTNPAPGMLRLANAGRIQINGNTPNYIRFVDDYPVTEFTNKWDDTAIAGFSGDKKRYVVETPTKVIQRCLLLATDPGDLVLDPTCGSGTTATVAEQWGRRWITIDTSRVALALARARIMGARYPFYLLADSREGQIKEAEISGKWSVASGQEYKPLNTTHYSLRQGFVYERVPHITLKSIANNAEIDVIWEKFQQELEFFRAQLNSALKTAWEEWEIPREADKKWSDEVKKIHSDWWKSRIARQKEIDASISAKAEFEFLYDKPYSDNKKVRVAGPFTVESLSPHRVLGVDEDDELIDTVAEAEGHYGEKRDFAQIILENLRLAGVQQAHKEDKISFSSVIPWPGHYICAEGRYLASEEWTVDSGQKGSSLATSHSPQTTEKRAGIFVGAEFGTMTKPDIVAAARECGDAGFDVLIVCAFSYDAQCTGLTQLGRIGILRARMNADLHMADDLKNTGKGNLFVIFGEPDIEVVSEEWLVDSKERRIAPYEIFKLVSGVDRLAEINRLDRGDLQRHAELSCRREIWDYLADAAGRLLHTGEHRGGSGTAQHGGVSTVAWHCSRLSGGTRNICDLVRALGNAEREGLEELVRKLRGDKQNAQRTDQIAGHLPLTTRHCTQVQVYGVDVFDPSTGEVRSDGADGIACWFIDTDYNEESFFVRHAYFLGANDPYSALKTTLKAEINAEAWATLHSDTSRPFEKPKGGRIAVKVINHLGDEVMKVFRV